MTAKARIGSAIALGSPHIELLDDWDLSVVDFSPAGRAGMASALHDVEGLLVNSHAAVDATTLDLAPRLRAISTVSAGFDHIDLVVAARRSITVTTAPVLSDAVADLTLALIIMTARRLREGVEDLTRGVWSTGLLGTDVRGKRLLLVGFGRIGREVAARALACKMSVCAFDVQDRSAADGRRRPVLPSPTASGRPTSCRCTSISTRRRATCSTPRRSP